MKMSTPTVLLILWVFIGLHCEHVIEARNHSTKLASVTARVKALERQMNRLECEAKNRKGDQASTFVRWGRMSCTNQSELVYSGLATGKYFAHKGSGSNRLCLPKQPQFKSMDKPQGYGLLYGAEYQYFGSLHDHEVPCAVCRTPHASTLMIPAILTCPVGWTCQYSGYLAASHISHFDSDFVCLDEQPEKNNTSNVANQNGNLFFFVLFACGSLPCGRT